MRLLVTLVFLLLAGCASHSSLSGAVEASSSFRRAYDTSPERARWFVDGTNDEYPVIYVGYDMGTHYTRSATLRVRKDGVVEREIMTEDGELIWVEDR